MTEEAKANPERVKQPRAEPEEEEVTHHGQQGGRGPPWVGAGNKGCIV